MVKLEDFEKGDIVLAVRMPKSNLLYQVLTTGFYGESKITYYISMDKDQGPAFTASIKDFEPNSNQQLSNAYPDIDFITTKVDVVTKVHLIWAKLSRVIYSI